MAGIAYIGLRLVSALTIVQSITVFSWSTWGSRSIGFLSFVGAVVLWLFAERVALMFTGTTKVESWAEQWSVWAMSMYGVYLLVWYIPTLITRNSFGIWVTPNKIDDHAYWFVSNSVFLGVSLAAVLFVIGPSKVWKYIALKWESSSS